MKTLALPLRRPLAGPASLTAAFRARVLAAARRLTRGELVLHDATGETHRLGRAAAGEPTAALEVRDPAFWREVALGGSLGAGEAFALGHFRTEDPVALVRLFLRNHDVLHAMESGMGRLAQPMARLAHRLARNTQAGARRNVLAHYDLGNDFYSLFLDETLSYSSAIFEHEGQSLAEASTGKNERICRKLGLTPAKEVLEIGTGWGEFALHAAGRHGCRVVTTTLSEEQRRLAVRRVADAGLADRVTVLGLDYRRLSGRFDAVVSVEMIEAVGHEYHEPFFRKVTELLRPEGAFLLQAITLPSRRFEAARHDVDFIKRWIFPGSCIPSVSALVEAATRAGDLELVHLENIGDHYALTLAEWRRRFLARREEAARLGHAETFLRAWEWYLAYCEAGFRERWLGDVQMLFTRPEHRASLPLGRLPSPC